MSMMWSFHAKRGREVTLTNNNQTARRGDGNKDGIAVASQCMSPNQLFEVRVDEVEDDHHYDFHWWLTCGVLKCETMEGFHLPRTAYKGFKHSVVFNIGVTIDSKPTENPAVNTSLYSLKEGDRAGLMLDDANRLHLSVNGSDVVVVDDVSPPCFAFFELDRRFKQVTTLPLQLKQ